MNEPEAFQLLTLASARDGRTVTQSVAKVWAQDLARVELRDAVEAVSLHYQRSDKWLMPSHVIEGARRVREARERAARMVRAIEPNRVTFDREKWDRDVAAAIRGEVVAGGGDVHV